MNAAIRSGAAAIHNQNSSIWMIIGFMLGIKFMLIRSYHSTDFEVHRNWMAITYHLPIEQWYRSNLSECTLDYPPFFAYFERTLSLIASLFDPTMLALQEDAYFSENTLLFQRFSVIAVDIIYFLACISIVNAHVNDTWVMGEDYKRRLRIGLFALFACNPALIMLDNVHFQYNAFLYGIFLFSLTAIFTNHLPMGAMAFSTLLNFKHLYLYYAPAIAAFYFSRYLLPIDWKFPVRITKLGLTILCIFSLSFGPFLLKGGIPLAKQILTRLFPFKRGLTHANWAPNFWVLYNLLDFALAKLFGKLAKNCLLFPWNSILKVCPPAPPEYTRGLVKEYSHSVLPDVGPAVALALVLLFLGPCLWIFTKKGMDWTVQLLAALALSAYAFFLFGWHVHEKAILMMFFPMALLAVKDLRFLESFSLLCVASTFAQFPLLFTPVEILLKWALALAYFVLCPFLAHFVWHLHPAELVPSAVGRFLVKMLFAAELYALIHPLLFPDFPFLPIILSSFACSLAVSFSYLSLFLTIFAEDFCTRLKKSWLLGKEKKILKSSAHALLFDAAQVRHIAGIDLSHYPGQPSLGVVSLTVLAFPSMDVVYCADEFVLLGSVFSGAISHYIPEYLALREAGPLGRALSRHIPFCPRIGALFVDSNGEWHSRGCGLACHVGYDAGLCTVGVAKTFNGFPLYARGLCELGDLRAIQTEIERECGQSGREEAVLFELRQKMGTEKVDGGPRLAVIRTKSSKTPFYISAGFGIDFDEAKELAFSCLARNSATVSPIRMSDLRSRQRIEEAFER